MPGEKSASFCFKARNYRLIVLLLVLLTFSIFLVFLFGSKLIDTSSSQPTPITSLFNSAQNNKLKSNENILTVGNSAEDYGKVPQSLVEKRNLPLQGRSRSKFLFRTKNTGGTCDAIREFMPDIDANKIYPTLPFDAKWIDTREYWNTFFEERFRKYREKRIGRKPLKVFVIPHSHTDPGWLRTFEDYFHLQVKNIIDNVVDKLEELPLMKFQLSEISFLAKWWKYAHPSRRELLKKFVGEGRLEIVTGGWVMTDEATVHLYSMVDQLIEGHQWLKSHLNIVPKSSWSVDPFGHSSTLPYLLKSAGMSGMVIQRIHYAWKKWLAESQSGDFKWVQRWDTQNEHGIFCHNAPFDIYSIKHSCGPHPQICLNFDFRNVTGEYAQNLGIMEQITRFNLKVKAELLLEQYEKSASLFPHNVIMVSLGDDFRFDRQIEWNQQYFNYQAIFNYINTNKERYGAELKFGTISEYFEAVRERSDILPTFSGDFFVYSDIFSEGRPAYWSGYFGTRPYWKKYYRETESIVRSAEILFSYAIFSAKQKRQFNNLQVMNHEYSNLVQARQWLALFAHHDATTGTSKMRVMDDYGLKLLDAKQDCLKIQMIAINSILFGQNDHSHLSTDTEESSFSHLPQKVPIRLNITRKDSKKIVLFNSLGWQKPHLARVVVKTPYVKVMGPDGKNIDSQLNPIMDLSGEFPIMSSLLFELVFIANLPPLSISTFVIKICSPRDEHRAEPASVYCRNCTGPKNLFETNAFQAGNIQLTNSEMQLLFDRNTGFLLAVKKPNENISIDSRLSFGAYNSIDFKSGAYLLMLDAATEPKSIPYPTSTSKVFIISGTLTSELSVSSSPLLVSTQIFHSGGATLESGIFIQNTVDVGMQKGEFFMRLNTDIDSTESSLSPHKIPIFYTDQNGFTIEKRRKIESLKLEGNYYPVTTMSFIEDVNIGVRASILVDRAHGFSSFEPGRLETLIERRTVYDDARGMGEGVTDNRATMSNYVLLVEKINQKTSNNVQLPTALATKLSQFINYPPSLFVLDFENFPKRGEGVGITNLLTQELPCDTHLINLRTLGEDLKYDVDNNLPSGKALLVVQRLAHYCTQNNRFKSECGSSNRKNESLFYHNTSFSNLNLFDIKETDLTGINEKSYKSLGGLDEAQAAPFQIKTFLLSFE